VDGPCEHGNEPSGSIKCWKILEKPWDWRLLNKLGSQRSWRISGECPAIRLEGPRKRPRFEPGTSPVTEALPLELTCSGQQRRQQ
jgi:hypothetical protein